MSTPTTEPTETNPQGTQGPQGPPDPAPDPTEAQEAQDAPESGNSEAARYRRRLRDAEAERDAHATRIEAFQRRDVARLAGETLAQPSDLFDVGGRDLADLLDDAGEVDADKVTMAAAALLESRPGLAKAKDQVWPADTGQGRQGESFSPAASWAGLLGRK